MDLIFPRMIYLRRTIKKSSKTPNCSTLSTYARKRCTCAPAGLLSTRENETASKFPAVQWPKKVDISRLYRVTERGIRTDWLFSRDTRCALDHRAHSYIVITADFYVYVIPFSPYQLIFSGFNFFLSLSEFFKSFFFSFSFSVNKMQGIKMMKLL